MNSRRTLCLAGVALVLGILAAYQNCLNVPFLFDDYPAIVDNRTLRQLWRLDKVLSPPLDGAGVVGRPVVNLSLAVNYALGGLDVRGYHLLNLLLHILTALTVWGVLRRTLRLPAMQPRFGPDAEPFAWTVAMLWAVHPLLTESVVCIVQRTEVLGALFYLLTLYCFIRAVTATKPRPWQMLTVAACLLGVASKEIVATAPLLVLLYDRTFVAGNFRDAWQRRRGLYWALVTTWLPLAWLMTHTMQRGGTVGFGLGMSSWYYLLTQCEALTLYLKLAFWPHPLVVDYGLVVVKEVSAVWWQGLLVIALLLATGFALWRKPVAGFLGACFFVIMAPSSSFVPLTTQPITEHRMYLSLIALIVLVAGAAWMWRGRAALAGLMALAVVAGGLTGLRVQDYQSELSIWRDTVTKRPSARALASLATAHYHQGNFPEATRLNEESLRLDPDSAQNHFNLGLALVMLHRDEEAMAQYKEAVRLLYFYPQAHAELGRLLIQAKKVDEGICHLRVALSYIPDMAPAHFSLGLGLAEIGDTRQAADAFSRVLQLDPTFAGANYNLGIAMMAAGHPDEARAHYEAELRIDPRHAEARLKLGVIFSQQGKAEEALLQLREAVRLRPSMPEMHANLGIALAVAGRPEEALASYETALRLRPDYAVAHYNLGNALVQLQRWAEARQHFAEAVRLSPDFAAAREMMERMQGAPAGP